MARAYAYLELEGIEGESQHKNYTNKIECQSWGWGSSNSSSFEHGTGGGVSQGKVHDLQLTKYMDKSSVRLHQYATESKQISKAKFTVLKEVGEDDLDFYVVELEHIIITSYHVSGGGNGTLPSESFSLHFAKCKPTYKEQSDSDGSGQNPVPWEYDIRHKG